ncbi:DUF3060 domain-containing protein [Microbacterium sp. BG28]|uniref:DUF3060 domain-containing protein n=1 Tax=Microbacterium sp. BG28 TaxID=3097356 RepID=UPI002A5A00DA|nr:DUF3060 domain-containing protein [Microbacterium sp. BG28]MDY0830023.1 DUF3060 domain-containing protein [Microbacterium sp. BG28]
MKKTLPITLAALAVLLTGCSVAYEAPGAPAADPAPSSTPAPAASASKEQEPNASTPPSAASTDLRARYADVAQQTSCVSGEVVVSQAGATVSIAGECALVTVTASGAVVLAEGIGTLEITGAANQVQAASVDIARVGGSGNDLRWESGTPDVTDTGVANTARATTRG